jgi:hypothetical protein
MVYGLRTKLRVLSPEKAEMWTDALAQQPVQFMRGESGK